MEGLATARLHVPAGLAPGGLGLVQELVNTGIRAAPEASHVADLLDDADGANRWLAAASRQWADATGQSAPELHIGEADLAPLRRLRESVRVLAGRSHEDPPRTVSPVGSSVTLRFDGDGRVSYGTAAVGWRGVAALVAAEVLLAQHTGTWERFKVCPFPTCGVAFFDQTRNNNRVWHDVRICGNRTNLEASRQRRRAGSPSPAGSSSGEGSS